MCNNFCASVSECESRRVREWRVLKQRVCEWKVSEAESVGVRENAQRDVQVDRKKHSGDDLA